MKQNLFILAVTAFVLSSCSNDEVTAVNESLNQKEEISFIALTQGTTRAAYVSGPITGFDTGDKFNVYADYNGAKYFQDDFTKQASGTFSSTTKYYWPEDISSTKKMTFTAVFGATQKADNPGVIEDFQPAAAAASQIDVLVAKKAVEANPGKTGVPITFRHALSQVVVKVKNTDSDYKITISDVRLGQVKTKGTLNYSGDGSAKVAQSDWGTPSEVSSYTQSSLGVTFTGTNGGTSDGEVITLGSPWLIIPQAKDNTQAYSAPNATEPSITGNTEPTITGNYLALKMVIKENATGEAVVSSERWCCWPIAQDFVPGFKYTFTIDAGTGGYQPVDVNNNKETLDKVLRGVISFSASCDIEAWTDATAVDVQN